MILLMGLLDTITTRDYTATIIASRNQTPQLIRTHPLLCNFHLTLASIVDAKLGHQKSLLHNLYS